MHLVMLDVRNAFYSANWYDMPKALENRFHTPGYIFVDNVGLFEGRSTVLRCLGRTVHTGGHIEKGNISIYLFFLMNNREKGVTRPR